MNKALATPLALCLLLAAGMAQAQYLNMLGASPVSKFTDADTKLMMTAIDKALTNPSDGVAQPWRNDASPANGVVTARKSYVADGRKCRDLLVANNYKTLKGEAEHTFCQDGAGQWKLVQ
jgi:surface antigen